MEKLIYDPIHSYIKFSGNCIKIIDSITFKRLQSIKQLGACYYVFPGATHNRFEHSLGVAHLSEKMIINLKNNQPELKITDKEIELIKIAALCHDLGHGPFSHAFDRELLPIILKDSYNEVEHDHEIRSGMLVEYIVKTEELDITDEELIFIKTCINPNKDLISKIERPFLYEIVANPFNGIDVDKFDYIKRDNYNLGLDYSFNSDRLISEARVINGHICFPEKLAESIFQMFQNRYILHRQIYNHPVVKSIEYMIVDSLIKSEGVLKLSEKIFDETFINITDHIMYLIEISNTEEFKESREILDNIKLRKLYKFHEEFQVSNKITREITQKGFKLAFLKKYNIDRDDIIIQHFNIGYGNNEEYPLKHVNFYKYNDNNKSFHLYKKNLNILLPSSFSQKNNIRIFSRRNHENIKKLVKNIKTQINGINK